MLYTNRLALPAVMNRASPGWRTRTGDPPEPLNRTSIPPPVAALTTAALQSFWVSASDADRVRFRRVQVDPLDVMSLTVTE